MIDFTTVKFDADRKPYIVKRGARGKFERHYLNDAEQQAHKEWDSERVSRLNSQAVAPARGQTKATQTVDTLGVDRADARNSTLRSGYLPEGCTGVRGGCAGGPIGGSMSIIPATLESGSEDDVPPGLRVARRSVNLMVSLGILSQALYQFGAINTSIIGEMSLLIENTQNQNGADSDDCPIEDGGLMNPVDYLNSMAHTLAMSYTMQRSTAPLKVVGYHAAPIFTLAQYLMGLVFPEGDMAKRAQAGTLLHRAEGDLQTLVQDILTVYNNVQADISEAGRVLIGDQPEEIGEVRSDLSNLSLIETVQAVDEMLEFLCIRIDGLSEMLRSML